MSLLSWHWKGSGIKSENADSRESGREEGRGGCRVKHVFILITTVQVYRRLSSASTPLTLILTASVTSKKHAQTPSVMLSMTSHSSQFLISFLQRFPLLIVKPGSPSILHLLLSSLATSPLLPLNTPHPAILSSLFSVSPSHKSST